MGGNTQAELQGQAPSIVMNEADRGSGSRFVEFMIEPVGVPRRQQVK